MALATEAEIQKKYELRKSLVKSIGGVDALEAFNGNTEQMLNIMSSIQLSDKKMCSILRGSVRKTWMMSPVRLLKLELARLVDIDPKTRTKWYCLCEHCGGKFKMSDVEVDHKNGEHQLLTLADVEQFARSILDVTLNDLQVFCKGCHEIKTYAERYNMTFEEATIEKKVIAWMKTNKTDAQKKFLCDVGYSGSPELISNNELRKVAYRKHLNNLVA